MKGNYKHGMSHTRLDNIYKTIKARCYKTSCRKYQRYGARGIKLCDEWLNDKTLFFDWAFNNGYSDDLTIDRIDNNGNYEPSNCRWATHEVQANNKSTNVHIEYQGKRYTMADFCRTYNLKYKRFHELYRTKGYELCDAIKMSTNNAVNV